MELEKIVRVIGSFILALIIIAIPFICALSYALNWSVYIKIMLTLATIGYIMLKTMDIYFDTEE